MQSDCQINAEIALKKWIAQEETVDISLEKYSILAESFIVTNGILADPILQ